MKKEKSKDYPEDIPTHACILLLNVILTSVISFPDEIVCILTWRFVIDLLNILIETIAIQDMDDLVKPKQFAYYYS